MTFGRLHVTIFVGLAAAVWTFILWLENVPITAKHFGPFSTVVGVLVLTGLLFEYVGWHWSPLHGWLVERPDLRGTWRVKLLSSWIDPTTHRGIPPIEAYMAVTQTFSTLQMHLMTPESESWFIADRVRHSPKGQGYQVAAVYTNQPGVHLRGVRSDIHYGALVLDTHGETVARPDSLTGEYWTDRATKGTMELTGRVSGFFSRYEDARAGCG